LKLTEEKKFNYILMKMGYNNGAENRKAVVVDDWNMKTLVGEYKIMLDKMKMNIPLTEQEQQEHRQMVAKWEADLYD